MSWHKHLLSSHIQTHNYPLEWIHPSVLIWGDLAHELVSTTNTLQQLKRDSFHHHLFSSLTESLQTGHYCRDDWMHPITRLSATKSPPCGINKAWFNLKCVSGSSRGLEATGGDIYLSFSLSQIFHFFVYLFLCWSITLLPSALLT